jgi:hypothetical protein
MEYVEGVRLDDWVERAPNTPEETRGWLRTGSRIARISTDRTSFTSI